MAMFREAMKCVNQNDAPEPPGDNVTKRDGQRETGNSRAYSIARVQKECDPEVVAKVMSGEAMNGTLLANGGDRKTDESDVQSGGTRVNEYGTNA